MENKLYILLFWQGNGCIWKEKDARYCFYAIWRKELCHAYEMKRMSPSCPKQLNLGNLKFKYTYIDQSARKQNTIKNQNHFRLEF